MNACMYHSILEAAISARTTIHTCTCFSLHLPLPQLQCNTTVVTQWEGGIGTMYYNRTVVPQRDYGIKMGLWYCNSTVVPQLGCSTQQQDCGTQQQDCGTTTGLWYHSGTVVLQQYCGTTTGLWYMYNNKTVLYTATRLWHQNNGTVVSPVREILQCNSSHPPPSPSHSELTAKVARWKKKLERGSLGTRPITHT